MQKLFVKKKTSENSSNTAFLALFFCYFNPCKSRENLTLHNKTPPVTFLTFLFDSHANLMPQ